MNETNDSVQSVNGQPDAAQSSPPPINMGGPSRHFSYRGDRHLLPIAHKPEIAPAQSDSQLDIAPKSDEGGSTSNQVSADPAKPAEQSNSQPSTLSAELSEPRQPSIGGQPTFPRCPGETPRAFSAFMTFFRLGHGRSLQSVSDKLGEQLPTLRNWSSRFEWNERVHQLNSGLLQKQIEDEAEVRRKAAAEWEQRNAEYRELEWQATQRLLSLVQCCIENFGDRDLEKMRLSELSRALSIATTVSRSALDHAAPDDNSPRRSPVQNELLALLAKMPTPQLPPKPTPTTNPSSTNTSN